VSEAPRWGKKDSGLVGSIAWKKTSARVWERETYALVTAENDHCLCVEFSSMQKDKFPLWIVRRILRIFKDGTKELRWDFHQMFRTKWGISKFNLNAI